MALRVEQRQRMPWWAITAQGAIDLNSQLVSNLKLGTALNCNNHHLMLIDTAQFRNNGQLGGFASAANVEIVVQTDGGQELLATLYCIATAGSGRFRIAKGQLTGALDCNAQNVIGMGVANAYSGGSTLEKALSGDIVLECSPATAGTSAGTLNAAAVGTFTVDITINLKDAAGTLHKWASLALVATTEETVADADVAAPAMSDSTPDLVNGTIVITLTYDTDAGATKTYAAGETVTLKVNAQAEGVLGYVIAEATFVDTLVA